MVAVGVEVEESFTLLTDTKLLGTPVSCACSTTPFNRCLIWLEKRQNNMKRKR